MRRLATLLLIFAFALPVAACGSSSSGSSASGGHHIISKVFCAVTVYSLYRDVRAHRLGWAAFQALLAHHNCRLAFSRP